MDSKPIEMLHKMNIQMTVKEQLIKKTYVEFCDVEMEMYSNHPDFKWVVKNDFQAKTLLPVWSLNKMTWMMKVVLETQKKCFKFYLNLKFIRL